MCEDRVVPFRLFAVARDIAALEVAGHGGSMDAEFHGESADGLHGPLDEERRWFPRVPSLRPRLRLAA